ncbi:MAG TPA: pyrroline-5-carboxylate reductase [Gammaproteobacteria bacterium]|nr:pyrroline-5-carboxylate reductase [Gammaproteobacteria bacterium]
MITNTISIIGAGNMGTSLLAGLIANQYPAKKLWITDPDIEKLNILEKQFNIHTNIDNEAAIKNADVVILAVKPQVILNVVKPLASLIQERKTCVISVAAGIPEKTLQKALGGKVAIVRCMPNTPALIGAGATALYANSFVDKKQHELAESILRAVGMVIWLENEKDMDAVTALSGSGPAYFFLIMEALQAAGEKLGLPQKTACLLTLQTAFGAAKMALESNESAKTLRERVTSPGGTTEAAVHVMEKENLQNIILKALEAAHARSKELAER